jgi:methionine-rich copper-binding protein CopC
MNPTLPRFRTLVLALLTFGAAAATLAAEVPHFALAKSSPADEEAVHHVAEVKLWFTEPPADGTVSIRLLDAQGEVVPTTDPTADPEDATAFAIAPENALAAGTYAVSWRGMGGDGHVVKGALSFTVAGH